VFPYWQTLRPNEILNKPIALAQALDREAYELFRNGCSASGVLQTDGTLTESAYARLKEYLDEFKVGGKNAGAFMVLEEGLKYASARMTNKDAEFVELKKQAIRDASAIWGVPSFQLGDGEKANYSSQEEQNRFFLYTTMMSRAKLIANELNNKLLTAEQKANGEIIEFDLRGILQGSMKDRAEYYTKLYYLGAITINTICEMEDLPLESSEFGDMRFVQQNMQPITNLLNQTKEKETLPNEQN
jgi:HK97 family phage portal protein